MATNGKVDTDIETSQSDYQIGSVESNRDVERLESTEIEYKIKSAVVGYESMVLSKNIINIQVCPIGITLLLYLYI